MPKELTLPYNYQPRPYQLPILRAMDSGTKRAVWVAHRRSGKDKTCLNITIKKMQEKVGVYFYLFPTFTQAKKVIWDGKDGSGFGFRSHFPNELIDGNVNETELKIKFKNGSIFQLIGTDTIDRIVGTNPIGVVFSEFSLQDPRAWGFLRPILAENGGWAIFVGTPRGENHFYDLHCLAQDDPEWFSQVLTVDDTKAISPEVLANERREIIRLHGNDALFQQEYYCSFSVPIAGAYYAHQVMQAYKEGRVTHVPHEPMARVHTVWDLGVNDRNSIWFFQHVGGQLRLIDFYENSGVGLPHYAEILQEKTKELGYIYERHIGPHDTGVQEWSSGKTRIQSARDIGIKFQIAPKLPVLDGITAVRNMFPKLWIDQKRCAQGLNALKNYHHEYDEERKTYLPTPKHDWSSNAADSLRYMAVTYDFRTNVQRSPDGDYGNRKARSGYVAPSPMVA